MYVTHDITSVAATSPPSAQSRATPALNFPSQNIPQAVSAEVSSQDERLAHRQVGPSR